MYLFLLGWYPWIDGHGWSKSTLFINFLYQQHPLVKRLNPQSICQSSVRICQASEGRRPSTLRWGVAKGSSVSWVAKFKEIESECKLSQRRALYGPIPVKTETFRELWAPLVHTNFGGKRYGPIIGPYLFLGKFVWTNGPESSSKVSPYTGIGPWMALPSVKWVVAELQGDKLLLPARKWVVAKSQGDKSASQSSMELYDPWISGPLRNSSHVVHS